MIRHKRGLLCVPCIRPLFLLWCRPRNPPCPYTAPRTARNLQKTRQTLETFTEFVTVSKRAANGPHIAICLGGWVLFDRPSKEKRLFFFSPQEGIRYLYNTDRNWAVINDRGDPSAIQLFSISLTSFVRILVTASICFVEICCCARVWGHALLPAALASMPFGCVLERYCHLPSGAWGPEKFLSYLLKTHRTLRVLEWASLMPIRCYPAVLQ